MDPNAALKTIHEYLAMRDVGGGSQHEINEFVDAVEALDTWLTAGGFLPDAWNKKERQTPA